MPVSKHVMCNRSIYVPGLKSKGFTLRMPLPVSRDLERISKSWGVSQSMALCYMISEQARNLPGGSESARLYVDPSKRPKEAQ